MCASMCNLTAPEIERFASTISDLSMNASTPSPRELVAQTLFDLSHADHYIRVLQKDDPITPRMRRYRKPMLLDDVVPREEVERLDFYNDFMVPDGMYHGINFYLYQGEQVLCDFRIFREKSNPAFTERELILIESIGPYLARALSNASSETLSVLTSREADVARLVARGCTDDDIGRILGIRFSTVRTHMNRCFEKLGCANRAELASRVGQRC